MKIKMMAALTLLFIRIPALSAATWGTPVAVGFHYPGFSARLAYRHLALEGLYMRQDDADAVGPRFYYFLNPGSRVVFNGGGEYAWVSGKTEVQKFKGRALTGFLGMEFFATRRTSIGVDFGVCRTSLDGENKISAGETGLVANIGVHLYL